MRPPEVAAIVRNRNRRAALSGQVDYARGSKSAKLQAGGYPGGFMRRFETWGRFLALAVIALALRLWLSGRGFNSDTETLFKISSLPWGGDYYKEFPYIANWGPIGYWTFRIFRELPGGSDIHRFHTYLALWSSSFDLLTGWVFWQIFGLRASALVLLSPAAAMIAGFHCNAEPALVGAAVFGFYLHWRSLQGTSMQVARSNAARATEMPHAGFCVALGVSLAFKHVFVLFPVWIALRPAPLKERLRCLALAYGTWLVIVSGYVFPDPTPFVSNVLLYSAWSGNALVPFTVKGLLGLLGISFTEVGIRPLWLPLFLSAMLAIGWRIRNWSVEKAFLLYPLALLGTSSAVALQYLAPPCFSIAADFNWLGGAYHLFTGWFLGGHPEEAKLWGIGTWFHNGLEPELFYWNRGWIFSQFLVLCLAIQRFVREERRLKSAAAPRDEVAAESETTAEAGMSPRCT